jgi:hypothetical protein
MLNRYVRLKFRERLTPFLPLVTRILLHFLHHGIDLVLDDGSEGSLGDVDYVVEIKDYEVGRESDDDCDSS